MFARPSSPCGHSLFFPKFILRSALSEHGVCISKIISDNTSYEQEEGMESKRGQELRNESINEKNVCEREKRGRKGQLFLCASHVKTWLDKLTTSFLSRQQFLDYGERLASVPLFGQTAFFLSACQSVHSPSFLPCVEVSF